VLNGQGEPLQQIGQYEVREKIAEGGFGVVYLARDPRLNREVAIKVLHAYHASDPARIARFVREAQSAAKLNHPGIVQIYDVVQTGDRMALVMEYVRGESLDQYLKSHPDLSLEAKIEMAAQIAETLDTAHVAGIIHRDVKPANVIIDELGRVKLTDFSLARLVDCSLTPLTGENNVLGTPAYMSPEQCLGKEAVPQSDLYSLGVVLHQMATGSLPFDADNYLALMRHHTDTPPTPVRLLKPSLPVALERLISKCLSKNIEKRPSSGLEVAQALRMMLREDFVDAADPATSKTVDIRLPEGFDAAAFPHTPAPGALPEAAPQIAVTPGPMTPPQGMPGVPTPAPMTPPQGMYPGPTPTPMPSAAAGYPGVTPMPMPPSAGGYPGGTPMPMPPQAGGYPGGTPMPMPPARDPGMMGVTPMPMMPSQGFAPAPAQEVPTAAYAPAASPAKTSKGATGLVVGLLAVVALAAVVIAVTQFQRTQQTPAPPAPAPSPQAQRLPLEPAQPSYDYRTPLLDYVKAPDDNYGYTLHSKLKGEGYTAHVLDLASQTWHADKTVPPVWRHWLTIIVPNRVAKDKAMLVFSDGLSTADRPLTQVPVLFVAMAMTTKSVVAILEGFPRDPVGFHAEKGPAPEMDFDTFTVNSFLRFLDTRDPTWPIVCPLVKSAVRAMDAIQSYLVQDLRSEIPVESFVLTGDANGWATWLTGAVDSRVAAIAPIQFDLLNIDAQIKRQVGFQAEMAPFLARFSDMDLLPALDSREGELLLRIIDPYFYRDRLTMPKLLLLPSNTNPFTGMDAVNLYWDDLEGESSLLCAPNVVLGRNNPFLPQQAGVLAEGETLAHEGAPRDFRDTLQVFYHKILVGKSMPKFTWDIRPDGAFRVESEDEPVEARLWFATADSRDFQSAAENKSWHMERLNSAMDGSYQGQVSFNDSRFAAFYVELVFPSMLGTNFSLTTPATILAAQERGSSTAVGGAFPERTGSRPVSTSSRSGFPSSQAGHETDRDPRK
jgi:serine/threonine protein kinase/PhoPQ-activated pathogenicity-related protein